MSEPTEDGMAEDGGSRYYLQRTIWRWHILCGNGTQSLAAFWRWRRAESVRLALESAYRDGVYVGGIQLLEAQNDAARRAAYSKLSSMPLAGEPVKDPHKYNKF